MKKDIVKIVLLLVILIGLSGGIYYGYKNDYFKSDRVKSNTKDNNKVNDNNKKANDNNDKIDNKIEDTKEDKKENSSNKDEESTKKVEVTENKPKIDDTPKKEENNKQEQEVKDKGDKYYKTITCSFSEKEDEFFTEYKYIGEFPAYTKEDFSPLTNMEVSKVEITINIPDYAYYTSEEKEEVNKFFSQLTSDLNGYNKSFNMLGNVAYYVFSGNSSNFINSFNDYEGKEVNYDGYLNYFKNKGIMCNQS